MYISVSFSMRRSRLSLVSSSMISWLSGGLRRKNGTLRERHHASALSTARMLDSVTFRKETNAAKIIMLGCCRIKRSNLQVLVINRIKKTLVIGDNYYMGTDHTFKGINV